MPQNAATLKTQIKDASLTTNINYLQPTGFRISIDRKRYPNLEFFCQSVAHPSASVSNQDMDFPRGKIPVPGTKMEFSTVSFTILLDENMESYKEMFEWLQRLVNLQFETAEKRRTAIPTHSDITLSILSSHNNTNKRIKYHDCIPTSLGAISFSSSGEGGYTSFSAEFDYSEFELL